MKRPSLLDYCDPDVVMLVAPMLLLCILSAAVTKVFVLGFSLSIVISLGLVIARVWFQRTEMLESRHPETNRECKRYLMVNGFIIIIHAVLSIAAFMLMPHYVAR